MGFGSGYSSRTVRGGKSYNNSMCAHVWNAGVEERGQSSNGNMYFRGPVIYSYGSHFPLAFRMPDGVVFVNDDSYSVSTSGHQSDVRGAIRDRSTVSVAGLADLAGEWKLLPRLATFMTDSNISRDAEARKAMQTNVRGALFVHADALESRIRKPGQEEFESYYAADGVTWLNPSERVRTPGVEAGAYLAALVGLPVATWPKIKREAAAAKAKAAAAKAKEEREAAERRALRLADMSGRDFRDQIGRLIDSYNHYPLREMGKELKRARSLMIAAKSGKLAATSRLAIVRARVKDTAAALEAFDARHAIRDRASLARRHIANVRAWRDAGDKLANVNAYTMRDLSAAGEYLAKFGRIASLRASGAKLNDAAHVARLACEAESARLAAEARAERQRELDRADAERVVMRARWLEGENVRLYGSFDSEAGGPALRVYGEELQTSWGATVPLAHAVRVFRFVKLCRDKGEAWQRNGVTVRVGHFQVDSISASGDFKAGCHSFAWSEVERVAKAAGVFECEASAAAVEPSNAHA